MLLETCLALLGQVTLAGAEFAAALTLTVLVWAATLRGQRLLQRPAPVPLTHSGSRRLAQVVASQRLPRG